MFGPTEKSKLLCNNGMDNQEENRVGEGAREREESH